MPNRKLGSTSRILAGMLFSVALAVVAGAQAPPQLQITVGPKQQTSILASRVSYGEVLRALQTKLGWEIEIPPLAYELKLSFVSVETDQPQFALAKLLEGSGLGYAFLDEGNKSRKLRVLVIPLAPRETKAGQDAASSPKLTNAAAGGSLQASTQGSGASQPESVGPETMPQQPQPPAKMSLAEALNAIGAPPGVALSDVGKSMTLPMSDAVRIMGAPQGISPDEVGKTITLPLPTSPGKHP